MKINSEKSRLKKLSPQFSSLKGFNSRLIDFRYQEISQYYKGERCLELGSADGQGTKHLVNYFEHVVAVDGSAKYIAKIKKSFPSDKVTAVCALFEDLDLKDKYDTVVLGHILEHVEDPVNILKIAIKFTKPDGVIIVDVPNANSLNRLVGVKMGMIKHKYELHAGDIRIGHRRVYTMDSLSEDAYQAGLSVMATGGVFLKPVSNDQIEKYWSEEMIQGFYELGKDFPQLCSDIYIVCSP